MVLNFKDPAGPVNRANRCLPAQRQHPAINNQLGPADGIEIGLLGREGGWP
jgi:hypothetical protein